MKSQLKCTGLHLNQKKTKVMPNTLLKDIEVDGEQYKVVDSFIFLGSIISRDGGINGGDKAENHLRKTGNGGTGSDIDRQPSHNLYEDKNIFNALVLPVMTYG